MPAIKLLAHGLPHAGLATGILARTVKASIAQLGLKVLCAKRARELAELLRVATEETMQYVPGFITANIHLSTDGTRVVNYAQWETAEAFQAMMNDPAAREHMENAGALATHFDPHLYTVESVHPAPSS
jgi:heme-degrading monooxygenase HmoA